MTREEAERALRYYFVPEYVEELINALSTPTCEIKQDNQGNLIAYCPHCHKAIWKTFKRENEDEMY